MNLSRETSFGSIGSHAVESGKMSTRTEENDLRKNENVLRVPQNDLIYVIESQICNITPAVTRSVRQKNSRACNTERTTTIDRDIVLIRNQILKTKLGFFPDEKSRSAKSDFGRGPVTGGWGR